MDFKKIGQAGVAWISLAQDRDKEQAVLNAVMKIWTPRNETELQIGRGTVGFSKMTLLRGVCYLVIIILFKSRLIRSLTTTGLDQRAWNLKVHISYVPLVTDCCQLPIFRYEFVILGVIFLTCRDLNLNEYFDKCIIQQQTEHTFLLSHEMQLYR